MVSFDILNLIKATFQYFYVKILEEVYKQITLWSLWIQMLNSEEEPDGAYEFYFMLEGIYKPV